MSETSQDPFSRFSATPWLRRPAVPFTAGDGFGLDVVNLRGEDEPSRGLVVLVHGAGVRANLFRALVRTSGVDARSSGVGPS